MTDLSKPLHQSYHFESLFLSKLLDLKHSLCIFLHGIRAEFSTMEPTTNSAQNTSNPTLVHSPLLLLNNNANLMSTKLDSTNYISDLCNSRCLLHARSSKWF